MSDRKKFIKWTIIIVLLTNLATFFITTTFSLYMPNGKVVINRQEYNNIMKFQKLFQVRNTLYKYYDGKINENSLLEGAVKGMTSALNDPYTVFMNKKEFEEFSSQTEGNYSGVGLQVQAKDNKIIVVDVFENSPSKKAGILPEDEIQKVNDKDVSGKELEKAVTLMKGEEGTKVKITLYRKDKGNYTVNIKRQKIDLVTVKSEIIEGNIGYIQIYMFDENTSKNFKNKLNELQSKGIKSLIVDLRGNPGGLLDECVDMVSNFVPKGKLVVSTIDKYKNEKKYKSKGGNAIGIPLIVLTNEGTASASEIFAGALKDYNAATLVGKKTFGKGVVQTILDTGDGTALKVTVSKYYTPSGKNIHKKGIEPDVQIDYPKELLIKTYDRKEDPQFNKALQLAKDKIK
ncbi:carboxy-terminal processing protease CtpA precursor [Clostridium acetireducens DSM 10703]|jgi:carboxyl-terminal processing protease|uniref:Carboxy-terminal processing protease CtpA n=1 Tax=Clostridium acetireducens DSM 10703 TaxID=1121290 RepID=A0A1E8F2E5_9CLOT|nr:S41 family peptidase [Clostridium acetireducens]OFI07501.1 carboxy-terminal processing protease CtpA precursor [Clostridium acetireducens DSM 10703]